VFDGGAVGLCGATAEVFEIKIRHGCYYTRQYFTRCRQLLATNSSVGGISAFGNT
jgi:hypothetical protein